MEKTITTCDHCGKEFQPYVDGKTCVDFGDVDPCVGYDYGKKTEYVQSFDLCTDCQKELGKIIHEFCGKTLDLPF